MLIFSCSLKKQGQGLSYSFAFAFEFDFAFSLAFTLSLLFLGPYRREVDERSRYGFRRTNCSLLALPDFLYLTCSTWFALPDLYSLICFVVYLLSQLDQLSHHSRTLCSWGCVFTCFKVNYLNLTNFPIFLKGCAHEDVSSWATWGQLSQRYQLSHLRHGLRGQVGVVGL